VQALSRELKAFCGFELKILSFDGAKHFIMVNAQILRYDFSFAPGKSGKSRRFALEDHLLCFLSS
jgi:hypothetical protein